jgi:asparagine synthase (glutamine-hydrolysing)
VPIRVWLKEDEYVAKIREAFSSEVANRYFETALLQKLVDNHIADKADNSRKIWTIYTFLVWYDTYFTCHPRAMAQPSVSERSE